MRSRLFVASALIVAIAASVALADPGFKVQFDEVCSKTDEAMALTVPELNQLLERCAKLRKALESEDETARRVYLKRIDMCENLYRFVLQSKAKDRKEEASK